ncbi:MAG: PAS domain S-box protein, partial [Spirochaetales bacterium]|nr:PAS domain S-box protein [Spirochaetales bacterium]
SGMFFGFITTLIATVIMAIYRLSIGGNGALVGVLIILCSSGVGTLWHRLRFKKVVKEESYSTKVEFLIVGIIIHVLMLFTLFFIKDDLRLEIIKRMSLPLLLVFPLGTYLFSLLLNIQYREQSLLNRLKSSEMRFKLIFRDAPMGVTVTDTRSGLALEVNQRYLDILGYSHEEYAKLTWMDITHPDDLEVDQQEFELLLRGEIDYYTIDKRYIRKDGSVVWVNIAVTYLENTHDNRPTHLCMVSDISARKEWEEAITYANTHDPLTDLGNRMMFEEALKDHDHEKFYPLAIITSDVNGLKMVNDAFGTEGGDELLVKIANEVKLIGEERGVPCFRIGGDSFAFILPNTSNEETQELIKELQERINPIQVQSVELTISFGMALKQDSFVSIDELLKRAENDLNRSKLSENPSSRSRAVTTILSALLVKNPREEHHSRRVSELASRLGAHYGLSPKEVGELKTVGLLHDIGKIAIDETILNKEGRLTSEEWEAIKRHPETGWRILSSAGEFGELATYVLTHHERIDGEGYPLGLKGDSIPLQARMIAIADAYDAMTSERPYKAKLTKEEAAKELKTHASTQFDSELAQIFVEKELMLAWDEL